MSESQDSRDKADVIDTSVMTSAFRTLVRARRSTRGFLPDPLDDHTLYELFSDAVTAPSNCNTQPWDVHVVSGEARDRMVRALLQAEQDADSRPDFSFDVNDYTGVLGER